MDISRPRVEHKEYPFRDIVGHLVAVRPPDCTEPGDWLPIYETEDRETAEILFDALSLRWGSVGPYRHFFIHSLRSPTQIVCVREYINTYQRILEVAIEYDRSFSDAAWLVERVASDQTTRIAEQYAYCVGLLKSLEDDATQGDCQAGGPTRNNESEPGNRSVEGDGAEEEDKGDKESQHQWRKSRVERGVHQYLKTNKPEYERLVADCLIGEAEATKKFRQLFGPTAIAEALGDNCTKQHISQCIVYQDEIRPVLTKPPVAPKNWQPPDLGDSPLNDSIKMLRTWAKEKDAEKCPSRPQQT